MLQHSEYLSARTLVPAALSLLALVSPQIGRGADQFGPFGPSVLYCFYECKPASNTRLIETTLLLLANQRPDVDASGAAIPHSRAHLVFLDGNERPLFRSFVDLSGNDLDEINVCHTIKANLPTALAPQAGVVQISIQDGVLGLPADGSLDPAKFEVGTGVVVWNKNVFGSFFVPPFPNADPDPFGATGVVRSIAKTTCLPADPHVIIADPVAIAAVPRAQVPPVLIERTADPIPAD